MKPLSVSLVFVLISFYSLSQATFPEKCIGKWKGTMKMYSKGILRDSVKILFTVDKHDTPNTWIWRTEYLSAKNPMTKDYLLRLHDSGKSIYVTDEKDGVELYDYLFDNKLYSVFETQGILLTSSYELVENELIFEVTSGKMHAENKNGVNNYSVDHLQRVVLRRAK